MNRDRQLWLGPVGYALYRMAAWFFCAFGCVTFWAWIAWCLWRMFK